MTSLNINIIMVFISTIINLYCWNKYRKEKDFNLFALQSFILGFGFCLWLRLIIKLLTFYYQTKN